MKKSTKRMLGKRIASVILSVVLTVTGAVMFLPQGTIRSEASTLNYDVSAGNVVIDNMNSTDTYVITGTSSLYNVTLTVSAGITAHVKFDGLNVDVSIIAQKPAVLISGAGNVEIILAGTNTLASGEECAGLQKNSTGTLTISGTGSLNATGGVGNGGEGGAGIGGGRNGNGFNITISGGIVTATGGNGGAGIGGGNGGNGSNITISDGNVTAIGGQSTNSTGAGIGGGGNGDGSNITISGGNVTATGGYGHFSGAGIGGGGGGGYGSDITISGGTVTATGGHSFQGSGAGIGGGRYGNGSNIIISGGTVTAIGGLPDSNRSGADIGGGEYANGENISISGGTVYSIGGDGGSGIGGGYSGAASGITVSGSARLFVADGPNSSSGISGAIFSPVTTGLYSTGSITYFPAGTTLSDIIGGTVQPIGTITGSLPAPTVVHESEPEPPVNYMQEVEDKITEAINLGGARVVRIEGYPALSYHVLEMLKEHPQITLVSEFTYDGLDYRITIPGSAVELDPSIKWYGPKYLFPMFYMYGTDTLPAVQAYLDKYES